jgi:hypothetical protein
VTPVLKIYPGLAAIAGNVPCHVLGLQLGRFALIASKAHRPFAAALLPLSISRQLAQ